MSTERTWQVDSSSLEVSLALAAEIGKRLRGGETVELVGDVGSGKTSFTRGLVKGLGSKDLVRSPSFTISNQYRVGDKTLYHFDFYRLPEPGIMQQQLAELVGQPEAIIVIEWSDIVNGILPQERLQIEIKIIGEGSRQINGSCPESLGYLFES